MLMSYFLEADRVNSFTELREAYVNRVLVVCIACGVPLLVLSVARNALMAHSLTWLSVVQGSLVVLALAALYYRTKLPFFVRGTLVIGTYYILGISLIYVMGLATTGWVFVTAGAVVTATIVGIRSAIFVGTGVMGILVLISLQHIYGPPPALDLNIHVRSPLGWTMALGSFAMITASVAIGAGLLHDSSLALLRKLEEKNAEIMRLANTDALTGLANRRSVYPELDRRINSQADDPKTLFVMLIDLDGFKEVNDSYGHDAGDFALQNVARVLRQNVRSEDFIARLGGDEFLIATVLPENMGKQLVSDIANRIIKQINAPSVYQNNLIKLGASIGIAEHPPIGRISADVCMKAADAAMYRVKTQKKNGFRFAYV